MPWARCRGYSLGRQRPRRSCRRGSFARDRAIRHWLSGLAARAVALLEVLAQPASRSRGLGVAEGLFSLLVPAQSPLLRCRAEEGPQRPRAAAPSAVDGAAAEARSTLARSGARGDWSVRRGPERQDLRHAPIANPTLLAARPRDRSTSFLRAPLALRRACLQPRTAPTAFAIAQSPRPCGRASTAGRQA